MAVTAVFTIMEMNRNIANSVVNTNSTSTSSNAGSLNGHVSGCGPMDSLPKQFVASMRTLFDIMDDKRTGFVRLLDIEHRWQDDGAKGLPLGVINSLRKVTPLNGMLSFERFCAGLKICLLRNQAPEIPITITPATTASTNINKSHRKSGESNNLPTTLISNELKGLQRPPSAPLLDLQNTISNAQQWKSNTAAVRPNNAISVQRAFSLPKLSPDSENTDHVAISDLPIIIPSPYAPPKPPRTSLVLGNGVTNINHLDRLDKAEIRHALQNWQMGILKHEMDAKDKRLNAQLNRGSADGSIDMSRLKQPHQIGVGVQKKVNGRRREPRRHTLQNGIDYNVLKKVKQLEQEKEVLLQGLNAVEKAHEWYIKQISILQHKINHLGKMGTDVTQREQWSEARQERLDLQRARIMEVNRNLSALAESWERGGFPIHMNLAVRYKSMVRHPTVSTVVPLPLSKDQITVGNQLQLKNRQLIDEVSHKNERIIALERERQSLISEMVNK